MDEPEQDALFYIEGPDERGCVWMHGTTFADPWAQNLGPRDQVAEVLSQWLASIDEDERGEGGIAMPRNRATEAPDARRQRLQEKALKQRDDAAEADRAADEMIERNIEKHGP